MAKIRRRFIVLVSIFLALDVALVAYLLWPGSTVAQRNAEKAHLQQQFLLNSRFTLKGMDQKLADTREAIKKFDADRTAAHWSQISNEIHKLAQENNVTWQDVHYKQEDSGLPGIQQVAIEIGIAGDYLKIAHFINAIERDKLLFVINQVALRGQTNQQGQPGGAVELQIIFETFLKEEVT